MSPVCETESIPIPYQIEVGSDLCIPGSLLGERNSFSREKDVKLKNKTKQMQVKKEEAQTLCPGHQSLGPENKGDRQQGSASPSLFKQDNDADWSLLPPSNLVCSQLLSKQEGQEELTIPAAENTMVPLKSLPSRLSLVGDREPFTYFTRKLASVVLGPQTMAEEPGK